MTERQKSWIGRRKSYRGGSSPKSSKDETSKKPRGTILNAVPPAKTIQMTPLEEEMATRPNEEILSAISQQTSPQLPMGESSLQTTPTQMTAFWNRSTSSLTHRPRSVERSETNSRIGMWVNGLAQWDEDALHFRAAVYEATIEEQTGFTPLRPAMNSLTVTRPNLSVVIPGGEPTVNDMSLSTIIQPRPYRPIVSVAPAAIVSQFRNTPAITVDEARDAPFADSKSACPVPPRVQPKNPLQIDPTEERRSLNDSRTPSTSSSDTEQDGFSNHSTRSSATSVEATLPCPERSKQRLSGNLLSASLKHLKSFEDGGRRTSDVNKPLPPSPIPVPTRSAPAPPPRPTARKPDTSLSRRVRQSRSFRSTTGVRKALRVQRPKMVPRSRSLPHYRFMKADSEGAVFASELSYSNSPTLSEAEHELRAQLMHLPEQKALRSHMMAEHKAAETVSRSGPVLRSDSVRSVMQPLEHAPTLPKRSRKREWRASAANAFALPVANSKLVRRKSDSEISRSRDEEHSSVVSAISGVRRTLSATSATKSGLAKVIPVVAYSDEKEVASPFNRFFIDDGLIVVNGPTFSKRKGEKVSATEIATASAEKVLLDILSSLKSTEDLFNMAMINKGMYRVYKENEMDLIRKVSYNQSPASWEFREWCPPDRNSVESSKASSQLEHTPTSYLQCHRRDREVIETLKGMILQHCQTIIRRETAFALSTSSHPSAQRFTDALWRIWCFCKIFGCEKGREDDITGQLDWLKGGILANNQGFSATVNTNLDFEMSSVLLNPPEYFAKGNCHGLNAQQLHDMTELWTCLAALLQPYQCRISQARAAGVFDECEIDANDPEMDEQHMLEEWTHYLLTQGLGVVIEMAEFATNSSAAGFARARENAWTIWSPAQCSGSRSTFLREPVSRLYEERVAAATASLADPRVEQEKQEMSRKRMATMAAEIRLRRQSSAYHRSPYIDQSMERTMSMVSRCSSTASVPSSSPRSLISPLLSATSSRSRPRASAASTSPTQGNGRAPNFSTPRPMSPGNFSGGWSPRKISPIIEERVESFNRMSLQNFGGGVAEDTSGIAVQKIVEMGFTAAQASAALHMTDMGDGLRVDRAVDMLLRQRG